MFKTLSDALSLRTSTESTDASPRPPAAEDGELAGTERAFHVLWPANRSLKPGERSGVDALKQAARDRHDFGR